MLSHEFKSRRNELLKSLGNDSIAVVFAAKEHDPHHSYRQNPDFYYLTGFIEPEAIAVLIPQNPVKEFILFSRARNPEKEIWQGEYVGQKNALEKFGATQAFPTLEADKILPQLLAKHKNIYSNIDFEGHFDRNLLNWSSKDDHKLIDLGKVLHELRLKKSQTELDAIRKAAEITAKGHLRAMKTCRPGMYEYELKAELLHEFTRLGGHKTAFEPIVAGGARACTLHYSKTDKKLTTGELVLVDAGIKYNYYSSDVSRTFPVNGKFTKEQQTIYEIVLAAQMEVIKKIRPGISWDNLQNIAEHVITLGLIDAGLLRGEIKTLLESGAYKPFFMHKIGHWLGLDTHDVGEYYLNEKWRTLEPGMVFTVEPGIYITPDAVGIEDKWLGTGIRIEDNILVTDNGYEILTIAVPKNVNAIEKIMKK